MKKVLLTIAGYSMGLACDASLIHNFFYKDRWNRYCENYITFFEIFSWFIVFCMVVSLISLSIANVNTEFLGKSEKSIRSITDSNSRLMSRIWYFANSLPMLAFVWIFVGDISLGIVWGICALLQPWCWDLSKRVKEKLSIANNPGARLADLLKRSYPDN